MAKWGIFAALWLTLLFTASAVKADQTGELHGWGPVLRTKLDDNNIDHHYNEHQYKHQYEHKHQYEQPIRTTIPIRPQQRLLVRTPTQTTTPTTTLIPIPARQGRPTPRNKRLLPIIINQ